jgi:type I restriction enzyme S subunit
MRRDWSTIKLKDATSKVGSGATPKGGKHSYNGSGVPLIRSMNVHIAGFRKEGLVFLNDSQAAALEPATVKAYDVLLNITGASIGRVTVAPAEMEGARVNQHVCIIRPESYLNARFLRWFLAAPDQQAMIMREQTGATRQGLTKAKILNFDVPLPPPSEQRRIVAKLEELFSDLDAGVAALERAQANLKRYRAAVLKAAVEGRLTEKWRAVHSPLPPGEGQGEGSSCRGDGYEPADKLLARILAERRRRWIDAELTKWREKKSAAGWPAAKIAAAEPAERTNITRNYKEPAAPNTANLPALPTGWCWTTIEQLNVGDRPISYGVLQPGPEFEHGVPLVRVCDVEDGKVRVTQLKKISPRISANYQRTILRGGEILLTVVGSIGRTAIAPRETAGANTARAVSVIPVSELANSRFIEIVLRDPRMQARLTRAAHEVARKTLNLEDVRAAVIPLASQAEQEQIALEVDRLWSSADESQILLEAASHRSDRLRQSILKRAFEGKLVPQDPNDEPSNVLLERIRLSRSAHEATKTPKSSPRTRRISSRKRTMK